MERTRGTRGGNVCPRDLWFPPWGSLGPGHLPAWPPAWLFLDDSTGGAGGRGSSGVCSGPPPFPHDPSLWLPCPGAVAGKDSSSRADPPWLPEPPGTEPGYFRTDACAFPTAPLEPDVVAGRARLPLRPPRLCSWPLLHAAEQRGSGFVFLSGQRH